MPPRGGCILKVRFTVVTICPIYRLHFLFIVPTRPSFGRCPATCGLGRCPTLFLSYCVFILEAVAKIDLPFNDRRFFFAPTDLHFMANRACYKYIGSRCESQCFDTVDRGFLWKLRPLSTRPIRSPKTRNCHFTKAKENEIKIDLAPLRIQTSESKRTASTDWADHQSAARKESKLKVKWERNEHNDGSDKKLVSHWCRGHLDQVKWMSLVKYFGLDQLAVFIPFHFHKNKSTGLQGNGNKFYFPGFSKVNFFP